MQSPLFLESVGDDGVARITLTRTEVHNAFNDKMIAELTRAFEGLDSDPRVRVVVLAAEGKSFSAGADLNWMKSMVDYSDAENLKDAEALAELMRVLNNLSKPTVALVQGAAFGGGVGLVACCDIVVASSLAKFCLSEVRLGLIPAVISPYVVAAMGERASRRYFLTAERFDATEAHRLGLVHEVADPLQLDVVGDRIVKALLAGGPRSLAAAKDLIFAVSRKDTDAAVIADTAQRIASLRVTPEAQEGLGAFLQKRKPDWLSED